MVIGGYDSETKTEFDVEEIKRLLNESSALSLEVLTPFFKGLPYKTLSAKI